MSVMHPVSKSETAETVLNPCDNEQIFRTEEISPIDEGEDVGEVRIETRSK